MKVRQHFLNFLNQLSYFYDFLKDAALDVKTVDLNCTNSQLQCRSVLTASLCATPSNGIWAAN
jgi:hypothetical protein